MQLFITKKGLSKYNYGLTHKLYLLFFTVLIIQTVFVTSAHAQGNFPENVQYKKIATNAMTTIASGNPDEAIKKLDEIFAGIDDNDGEVLYCKAIAYSVKNDIPKAMEHVKRALNVGIPLERFIAGPTNLAETLINSEVFQEFKKGRYLKLVHGPMLGDVTANGAKIWLRTDIDAEVIVTLFEENGKNIQKIAGSTSSTNGFSTVIQASQLKPSTNYTYTIHIDNSLFFEGGSFKTTKNKGESGYIKIGFGGGAGYTPWKERMWDTIAKQSFDAFLLLGDNVYIDYPKVPEAQEYCYFRRQSRPEFRRFTPNVPIYAIWDDHDFTINDGEGGPEIETPSWKRPVWNLFKEQWANPYYAGGEKNPGCWFDFSMGDVDFIMLDCRYYRENPEEITDPSMLGEFQKNWLKERLKKSTATFKVIASSVPWATNTKPGSDDTWDGFPKEREEIFSFIEENKIEGVLLISADRHRSDAWKIERPNGYTMYEFMSSKLTNVHTHKIMDGSLFGYNKKCSFGTIEFDTTVEDPSITYTVKNIENKEIHKMTLYKSQLDFVDNKLKHKKITK